MAYRSDDRLKLPIKPAKRLGPNLALRRDFRDNIVCVGRVDRSIDDAGLLNIAREYVRSPANASRIPDYQKVYMEVKVRVYKFGDYDEAEPIEPVSILITTLESDTDVRSAISGYFNREGEGQWTTYDKIGTVTVPRAYGPKPRYNLWSKLAGWYSLRPGDRTFEYKY